MQVKGQPFAAFSIDLQEPYVHSLRGRTVTIQTGAFTKILVPIQKQGLLDSTVKRKRASGPL